jgi:hypothetical protein
MPGIGTNERPTSISGSKPDNSFNNHIKDSTCKHTTTMTSIEMNEIPTSSGRKPDISFNNDVS